MKIRVLVSGAGGDVGQGVLKALASSSLEVETYAMCISPHSSWLHMGARGFIAPLSADPDYVPFLIRLIRRFNIQVFFPTVDGELIKIAQEKKRIEDETGALVFIDDLSKVAITDDKFETVSYLKHNGFVYPRSAIMQGQQALDFPKHYGFPLIVKRRSGKGNQEVFTVRNISELSVHLGNPDFMVQEWMDPAQGEYTSGFYIGDDGLIKGACTFRRELKGGSTFIAERIIDPQLEAPLERIASALGMKYLNIQSMKRGNQLVPFEFNGRLSGTTSIVSRIFNAPEMFIRERLLGQTLEQVVNSNRFVAMRYYEEAYASADDIKALISRSSKI